MRHGIWVFEDDMQGFTGLGDDADEVVTDFPGNAFDGVSGDAEAGKGAGGGGGLGGWQDGDELVRDGDGSDIFRGGPGLGSQGGGPVHDTFDGDGSLVLRPGGGGQESDGLDCGGDLVVIFYEVRKDGEGGWLRLSEVRKGVDGSAADATGGVLRERELGGNGRCRVV